MTLPQPARAEFNLRFSIRRRISTVMLALALVAACSSANLDDPRARALMAMPAAQHYAERRVARELVGRCSGWAYDEKLGEAMSQARAKASQQTALQVRGATDLEADIKRRSLTARYGGYDACTILNGETVAQSPLSVLVIKRN